MGPRFVPCAGPALPSPSITCLWAVSGLGEGEVSEGGGNRPPPPRLLMDLGLRGQTALVAAASRGLGKAVAKLFVEEGARVAICSRRKEAATIAVSIFSWAPAGAAASKTARKMTSGILCTSTS